MEKIQFVNDDYPDLSAETLNELQSNIDRAKTETKLMLTVGSTPPTTAQVGDLYYDTRLKLLFTAISENTWDEGTLPLENVLYFDLEHSNLYYYDGQSFESYGSRVVHNLSSNSEFNAPSVKTINDELGEVILYDSETGTTESGTIQGNFADHEEIEIYFKDASAKHSEKVLNPEGSLTRLFTMGSTYLYTASVSLKGNQFNFESSKRIRFSDGTTIDGDFITILRVVSRKRKKGTE